MWRFMQVIMMITIIKRLLHHLLWNNHSLNNKRWNLKDVHWSPQFKGSHILKRHRCILWLYILAWIGYSILSMDKIFLFNFASKWDFPTYCTNSHEFTHTCCLPTLYSYVKSTFETCKDIILNFTSPHLTWRFHITCDSLLWFKNVQHSGQCREHGPL